MVSFLLDKKRASSKSVNSAFVKVRSTDVLKLLLDREYILDESICAVFERETRSLMNIGITPKRRRAFGLSSCCTRRTAFRLR